MLHENVHLSVSDVEYTGYQRDIQTVHEMIYNDGDTLSSSHQCSNEYEALSSSHSSDQDETYIYNDGDTLSSSH
jgi:hypothetical protein